ncbi:hypothetical protein BSL78_04185 [Apostichopus japonicus]|uniref:Sulfotransferase domain-containing protein n=1 Tax=Stichopus japonicus TaxID=307972 RepID=A0A2G8LF56_STIJA|nr:hypothetical protein BSL78_04185 [Apostichopus japonicus]
MEPYMASNLNETIFSPTWRKGDPAIDKMRSEAKIAEEQSHYKDIKQRELEKVERYPNVWTQQTFSYPWAKKQLEINPQGKQFVFIKDQSCAIYDYMDYLPDVPTRHAFLIRHPMETYPSLKNVMINETFIDFGKVSWDESDLTDVVPYLPVKGFFEIHRNMWKKLKENGGPEPIIIDGHDSLRSQRSFYQSFLGLTKNRI